MVSPTDEMLVIHLISLIHATLLFIIVKGLFWREEVEIEVR